MNLEKLYNIIKEKQVFLNESVHKRKQPRCISRLLPNIFAGAGMSLHRLIADIGVFSEIYRDSRKLEKVLS